MLLPMPLVSYEEIIAKSNVMKLSSKTFRSYIMSFIHFKLIFT